MSDDRPVQSAFLRRFLHGQKLTALMMALVFTSLVATGFVWAHKTVSIIADGRTLQVSTFHNKVSDVLAQAGVRLGPQDEVRPTEQNVTDGATIEVFRAVPVTVTYAGQTQTLITGKPTVGELLRSLHIEGANLTVDPDVTIRPTAGMHIKVVQVSEKIVEREMAIPYSVEKKEDGTREKGTTEVVQQGQDGVKTVEVKIHFADGEPSAEEVLGETVKQAAQPEIIAVGTRDVIETSRGARRFISAGWLEATAYSPYDGLCSGITAIGIPARYGVAAVDPNVIPLGSRLYIPGYGFALAADTGGDIVGNRIDLCYEDPETAWDFGHRKMKVYILE